MTARYFICATCFVLRPVVRNLTFNMVTGMIITRRTICSGLISANPKDSMAKYYIKATYMSTCAQGNRLDVRLNHFKAEERNQTRLFAQTPRL